MVDNKSIKEIQEQIKYIKETQENDPFTRGVIKGLELSIEIIENLGD